MSRINVSNLTFNYEGSYDNIFEDVSFQIDTDWKLGLIGRNGRGKTTFLKLLQSKYEYKGSINASVKFHYFPYEVGKRSADTIEEIEEAEPGYELWKVCRELSLLEVDAGVLYRPFDTLSNGEQTKALLAVLFAREDGAGSDNFFLIDEPTNHLDMEARESVKEYLNRKKGFLLVSHDRNFMDGCVDHVLAINKSDIEVRQGNFSSWWENKRRQDAYELAENERLRKDIRRLSESAGRSGNWADRVESTKIGMKSLNYERSREYVGEKSRKMQMRRKNLERRRQRELEEKSSLLKNLETADDLKLIPLRHYKKTLIYMKDLSLGYGTSTVLQHFSLKVENGERIALQGRNGCGKTSILRKILTDTDMIEKDKDLWSGGSMELAGGLKLSYVSQDTSGLTGGLEEYMDRNRLDRTLFYAVLRKLDFERAQFEKELEELSGGQKKKVLIARSLCEQAHLYLWDEPLNFIDIFSRLQIEELILRYQPAMLFVEHDRAFVDKVATRVVKL